MKTIMVTGGAGFIGSNLNDRLLEKGYKVICIDNFDNYYSPSFKWQNIENALKHPSYQLYENDINDYEKLDPIFELNKIDCIIHLAARGGVVPSVNRPLFYENTNTRGTLCMLEMARHHHIPQFIFASSSTVYGRDSEIPFVESDPCIKPVSPYGATKRASELLVYTYHQLFNINCTILRFFNVYGPRSRPDMALYGKFTEKLLAGLPVEDWGTKRDFTYIDDIVDGIIAAIEKNLEFETINLGHSEPVGMKRYINAIAANLNVKPTIIEKPTPLSEIIETMANIDKAKRLLNFSPKTSVEDGVNKFVTWYKEYRLNPRQLKKLRRLEKIFVFDFDGVLFNAEPEKAKIFGQLIKDEWDGDEKEAEEFYFEVSGPSRNEKFNHYYRRLFHKPLPKSQYKRLASKFQYLLSTKIFSKSKLLPGAKDLLKLVKERYDYIYICSGATSKYVKGLVKILGIGEYFDDILTSGKKFPSKWSMLRKVTNKAGISQLVFISDSPADIKTAKEFGAITIGVPTNKPVESLKNSGADYVCLPKDCLKIIEKIS